jgi:uncharacterized protein (TIGR00369 family)
MEIKNIQQQLLQQLTQAFSTIPFNRMLGLKLDQVDESHVTLNFAMKGELVGNFLQGILHGGVISSVLDMAGGMMVMSTAIYKNADKPRESLLEVIAKTSTVDLQISYLRPGRGQLFTAKAWLIKSGKKISFARMELSNEEDTLLATGTGTYLCKLNI